MVAKTEQNVANFLATFLSNSPYRSLNYIFVDMT